MKLSVYVLPTHIASCLSRTTHCVTGTVLLSSRRDRCPWLRTNVVIELGGARIQESKLNKSERKKISLPMSKAKLESTHRESIRDSMDDDG